MTTGAKDDHMCECGRNEKYEQQDYYGIYAGRMCDQCFREKFKVVHTDRARILMPRMPVNP